MRNLWDSFSLNTCNLNVGTISALQRLLQLKTILFLTHLFVFPRESKRVRSSYSSVFHRCSIYSNLLSSSFFFFSFFLFFSPFFLTKWRLFERNGQIKIVNFDHGLILRSRRIARTFCTYIQRSTEGIHRT